jgi:hypothetical protein
LLGLSGLVAVTACSTKSASPAADARDGVSADGLSDLVDGASTPDSGGPDGTRSDTAGTDAVGPGGDALADAAGDAGRLAELPQDPDTVAPDGSGGDLETDSAPSLCLEDPSPGAYLAPFTPDIAPGEQGISPEELDRFETMAGKLLDDPSILFVDTWLAEEDLYLVRHKTGLLKFKRTFGPSGPQFEVVAQEGGPSPFSCTAADGLNTYEAELAAMTNPMGTTYPELGYEDGDPRVGFVDVDETCFPFPYLRIAQLYDAPDAPDFHYSFTPYGVGGGGSHGALDVFQSRTPLVISGYGVKKQVDAQTTPESVDIAPTVLWLMGGAPGPGLRHGVAHTATWLKWQDGRPLTGLLEDDGCVPPFQYVFIFLFDGLASNELVHLWESADPTIPAFSKILSGGTVFRNGAVTGFPTVSAPGHLTVGTGMYNGHHRFLSNGFYRRDKGEILSPSQIFSNQQAYIDNPQLAIDLFNDIFHPGGETMCEAGHRLLGDSLFCAMVNELTLRGADYNIVSVAENMDFRADYYELADMMAMPQLLGLIDEHAGGPEPFLAYTSFYKTDDAGEGAGPHGPLVRQKLAALDAYMGKFLERLEEKKIMDRSLVVLTSDHGMELQDKNRVGNWKGVLPSTGIPFIDPDGFGFVYLLDLQGP